MLARSITVTQKMTLMDQDKPTDMTMQANSQLTRSKLKTSNPKTLVQNAGMVFLICAVVFTKVSRIVPDAARKKRRK